MSGWRRWFSRATAAPGTGEPGKGVSSFHLWWQDAPPEPVVAVEVTLEVVEAPVVDRLYFWALQATFNDATTDHGGAHLGLQRPEVEAIDDRRLDDLERHLDGDDGLGRRVLPPSETETPLPGSPVPGAAVPGRTIGAIRTRRHPKRQPSSSVSCRRSRSASGADAPREDLEGIGIDEASHDFEAAVHARRHLLDPELTGPTEPAEQRDHIPLEVRIVECERAQRDAAAL